MKEYFFNLKKHFIVAPLLWLTTLGLIGSIKDEWRKPLWKGVGSTASFLWNGLKNIGGDIKDAGIDTPKIPNPFGSDTSEPTKKSEQKAKEAPKPISKVAQDYNTYKAEYEALLTHARNKRNNLKNELDDYINGMSLGSVQNMLNALTYARNNKVALPEGCTKADVITVEKALLKQRGAFKTSSTNSADNFEPQYVDVRPLEGARLTAAINAALNGEPNPAGTGTGKGKAA
jgi:hypothetical protein